MEIRWSVEAADDLERIVQNILQNNPPAARRVAKTLYDGIAGLRDFPNRGRNGRMEGTRELVFSPLPYIVVYRIKQQTLEVMRVCHAAQDWP